MKPKGFIIALLLCGLMAYTNDLWQEQRKREKTIKTQVIATALRAAEAAEMAWQQEKTRDACATAWGRNSDLKDAIEKFGDNADAVTVAKARHIAKEIDRAIVAAL